MIDAIRDRYDAVPYRHGAVPDSHPARLGVIGRMLGIPAAPPDRCRVLELGCGEGMNLLPLAERLPHSEFVGVDFSSVQIAESGNARTACDLGNARFICADLRSWEPDPGAFDYVIAHGVYSWVPDEVKDRLLSICARALAPHGIAYVSYNTLPGWGLPGGIREFLLTEMANHPQPAAQMDHARRVLEVLGQCLKDQPGFYAALLRETVADMKGKPPELLFHDELAAVNDPCTFTAFANHASRHSLHYLAEAHYASMHYEHVPATMRARLATLNPDFMRTQQFTDMLFQRWLRTSLLCLTAPAEKRTADVRVVADCALGLRLNVEGGPVDMAPGASMRLRGPHGLTLNFEQPEEKALLSVLAHSFPRRIPFPEACAEANQMLTQAGRPVAGDFTGLHGLIHRLFALDVLDLMLIGEGEWLRSSATPGPSPLMQYQAGRDLPLTNRWHEPIALTPDGKRALIDPSFRPDETALMRAGLLV